MPCYPWCTNPRKGSDLQGVGGWGKETGHHDGGDCLSVCLSVCLPVCHSFYLSACLSPNFVLSAHVALCLCICLFFCPCAIQLNNNKNQHTAVIKVPRQRLEEACRKPVLGVLKTNVYSALGRQALIVFVTWCPGGPPGLHQDPGGDRATAQGRAADGGGQADGADPRERAGEALWAGTQGPGEHPDAEVRGCACDAGSCWWCGAGSVVVMMVVLMEMMMVVMHANIWWMWCTLPFSL